MLVDLPAKFRSLIQAGEPVSGQMLLCLIKLEFSRADTLLIITFHRSQGKFAIEVTVTSTAMPTRQYEQAGITWYHNGKPIFKLVKELIDGGLFIIPGRKPMAAESVQLRVTVTANRLVAEYRPDGKGEFQPAGERELPPPADDQVSIQCYNGPPDAEHWIRFDDFRILKLE